MAEGTWSRIWLVNGRTVTVYGEVDQVVKTLESSRGGFATMKSGETDVRVNTSHVTHVEEA
jgi:hypothetical protein